jgi:hypothetical protein
MAARYERAEIPGFSHPAVKFERTKMRYANHYTKEFFVLLGLPQVFASKDITM